MTDPDSKDQIKIYGNTSLADRVAQFNKKTTEHRHKQMINPFSNWEGAGHRQQLDKSDVNYGRPVAGSKTEYRGKKAGELISSEIKNLCEMIWEFGQKNEDGTAWITFGELFEIYTRISNKLVGILMRARKYELLNFKGEMLFQRRDDDVVIELLRPISDIRNASRNEASAETSSSAEPN